MIFIEVADTIKFYYLSCLLRFCKFTWGGPWKNQKIT